MWLLAGLGNPGPSYRNNRHNIGFMALERIVQRYGLMVQAWRPRFQGEALELTVEGQKTLALKPLTYMNESGQAVREALQFYKIPLAQTVVLHDDLDLALGRVEVKQGGGHGGHNGLKSIDAHCGNEYWRIRLGIGHPTAGVPGVPLAVKQDLVLKHVLGNFTKDERAVVEPMLVEVAELLPPFIKTGEPFHLREQK